MGGVNTDFLEVIEDVKRNYDKNMGREVINGYGNLFSPDNLDNLAKEEFLGFLSHKNNKHWHGIQRNGSLITKDMDRLREALKILLDESKPIQERLDTLVVKNGDNYVKGLGKAVLTPILLTVYPDKYGVYNGITQLGLELAELRPIIDKKASFGEEYVQINNLLLDLAKKYNLNLIELDEVWGRMGNYYRNKI